MNEPKAPDDKRNRESMDIFLFSNGQQYSPPRKYHLRSDELQWWDATIQFLARCHYGTGQSIIELYSLNGIKIEGSLELKNDVAYVAVIPPDAFIPAGYEEYLIKAYRSREKRQEQLINNTAEVKPAENEVEDENKLDKAPKGKAIENTDEENINVNIEGQRNFNKSTPCRNKGDIVYKKKSYETNKGKVFKNNICPTKACRNKVLLNKKKSPMVDKIERNNKKNHSTYLNNVNLPLTDMNTNKLQDRQKLRNEKMDLIKVSKIVKNLKDAEPQISYYQDTETPNTELYNKQLKLNKDLTNIEDNAQSVLINTPKIMEDTNSNSGKIDFSYNNEIPNQESDISPNPIKEMRENTAIIDKQIQSTLTNKDKQININLNIILKNYSNDSNSEHLLIRCKSNTTLALDKASQIKAEVSLNKQIICFEENPVQINGVSESNVKDKENVLKLDNTKVIVVHCKCGSIHTRKMVNEDDKEKSNIILATTDEKVLQSDKHNQEIEIPVSNTNKVKEKILQREEGKRIIAEVIANNQDSMHISEKNFLDSKCLLEKSTQMDWCNILLQPRRHGDGRYTFHLPSLGLLKQYNMNTP